MKLTEKKWDFVLIILAGLVIALIILPFFACHTSPEVERLPVQAQTSEAVEAQAYPMGDILFSADDVAWYIHDFQWGVTYQVDLLNYFPHSVRGNFQWRVLNQCRLVWSGECCEFIVPPGASTVNVRIPSFELTPPICDEAVLTIRVY